MKQTIAEQTGNVIISISMLILSICSIIGLVYLTEFSFNSKKSDDDDKKYCITNFSKTKTTFSRLTVVLLWIQIALTIVSVLWIGSHLSFK